MKTTLLLCCAFLFSLTLCAQNNSQDYSKRWGIELTAGGVSMTDEPENMSANEGNTFTLAANYYLTQRLALSAGAYLETNGMYTALSYSGIGPKKYNMAGIMAGAKYYFFPKKWIVQPYIGGFIYTNILNLNDQKGSFTFHPNIADITILNAKYQVQCPVVSLAPQLGVDIRLWNSISLTLSGNWRWAPYGKVKATTTVPSGVMAGTQYNINESINRTALSIGLKIDFPMRRPVTLPKENTLFNILYLLIRKN